MPVTGEKKNQQPSLKNRWVVWGEGGGLDREILKDGTTLFSPIDGHFISEQHPPQPVAEDSKKP